MENGMNNLFQIPVQLSSTEEYFEQVLASPSCRVERIISTGHSSPEGFWYDQDEDEWVALLQGTAELSFDDGSSVSLAAGDHLLIEAHRRHRVERTSIDPPCVWLAVHGKLKQG